MSLAQQAQDFASDAPVTTGAIFVALTAAITYLYRARDRDRDRNYQRMENEIRELREQLQQERDRNEQ